MVANDFNRDLRKKSRRSSHASRAIRLPIQTPDPVDLHSQSTVIAGWKGDYASVQGVAQMSGAIFMGEMRLDANKRKLKTGT